MPATLSYSSSDPRAYPVLDPCTLGRPFHLLDAFHRALQQRIERHLHARYNRRRGARLTVTGSEFVLSRRTEAADTSWGHFGSPAGRIAVGVERRLLVALLAYHYGEPLAATTHDPLPPETGSEQRFAAFTQRTLLDELAALIDPSATFDDRTPHQPAAHTRVLRVTVSDAALGLTAALEFALDDAWLARLFAIVAPRAASSRPSGQAHDDATLASRIPVTLTVTMLTKELPLDDVLRLAPGDVLNVRLPDAADVLVEGSRLYRAAVAEQGGALCLTSFEAME
jgi:flagellar motor switch protein FliM